MSCPSFRAIALLLPIFLAGCISLDEYRTHRLPAGDYGSAGFGTVWADKTGEGNLFFLKVDGIESTEFQNKMMPSVFELPAGRHTLVVTYRLASGATGLYTHGLPIEVDVEAGRHYVVRFDRREKDVRFAVETLPAGSSCAYAEDYRQGIYLQAKLQCQ